MQNKLSFSPEDIRQIKHLGLNLNTMEKQLELFRRGSKYLNLNRPCRVNDGILSVTSVQRKNLISLYERKSKNYKLMKFVPASGAASRMFAEWFSARDCGGFGSSALNQKFLRNLKRYPFYFLIRQNKSAFQLIKQKNIKGLLDYILSDGGLNYGCLPKALIPFHIYHKKNVRTALEEHLIEAFQYIRGVNDECNLHFTILEEHKKEIINKIKAIKSEYEKMYSGKYEISTSFQRPSTKIIAVDDHNLPLRNKDGFLIFRPGGHGALLENLNKLNADFIFIKNIDNIAPQPLWGKIIPYSKMIGGLAIKIQEEIFDGIRQLESSNIKFSNLEEIQNLCTDKLSINFPQRYMNRSWKDKIRFLFSILNRPLRICGVVRNEKEPGGGPFWVEENDGTLTLQIVENAQVDKKKNDQLIIWSKAEYFNPVDIICSIKNYQGKKFNLFNYVNNDSYTISFKNEKGLKIKVLEMPGLWNGGMAYWNTVFVKLPLIVFNPVKDVNDLLRPEHLIW
ncbi:MAG: DUF4301 family protein [Syntrophaceae bacterium]|nr:DUF4301 family protein [Syntrophaceae bacterium]